MTEDVFVTERLYVRRLQSSDVDKFFEMQSDPEVMRYVKPVMTSEESRMELDRFMSYYDTHRFYQIWAVVEKTDNSFVGICGVYLNEKDEYEIAYRLLRNVWGMGYGVEVASNLIDYCFSVLNISTIVGYAYQHNVGSIKILEKLMMYNSEEREHGSILQKYIACRAETHD